MPTQPTGRRPRTIHGTSGSGHDSASPSTPEPALDGRTPQEAADLLAAAYSKQDLLVVVARLLAFLQDAPGAGE